MMEHIRLTAEDAAVIKRRITLAQQHQERKWKLPGNMVVGREWHDRPGRALALLTGHFWDSIDQPNKPARYVNQIGPKVLALESVLLAGKTQVFVEPASEEFAGRQDAVAAFLQQIWDASGWDDVVDQALRDSLVYGYGVVEVGWRWKTVNDQKEGERGEATVPEEAQPLVGGESEASVIEYATEQEAAAAARRMTLEQDAELYSGVTFDDAYVERLCPRALLVDPYCVNWDLSDARYVFRERYVPLNRVRANKTYNAAARNRLRGTVHPLSEDSSSASTITGDGPERDDQAYVRLYDGYMWWPRADGTEDFIRVVMNAENDDILLAIANPYARDDGEPAFSPNPYPWIVYPALVLDNDSFYPEAPVETASDLQIVYDQVFYALNEQRRRGTNVYFAPEGELSDQAKQHIESGQEGIVVFVPRSLYDGDVLKPLPKMVNEGQMLEILQFLATEIGRQMGVSQYEESILPEKQLTATEAQNLTQMGGSRTRMLIEQMNAFRSRILTAVLTLHQLFGDRPRPFLQTLPDGSTQWGLMSTRELSGTDTNGNLLPPGTQWRVHVHAAAEPEPNRMQDRDQKLKLLELLTPYAATPDPRTGAPMINLRPVLRAVLDAFDVEDIDAVLPEVGPASMPEQVPPGTAPGGFPPTGL